MPSSNGIFARPEKIALMGQSDKISFRNLRFSTVLNTDKENDPNSLVGMINIILKIKLTGHGS